MGSEDHSLDLTDFTTDELDQFADKTSAPYQGSAPRIARDSRPVAEEIGKIFIHFIYLI